MNITVKKCAIYTRKSTEKGLEQEFNTLDAQREACAAYIISQKSEGWTALDEIYDDGGYSGGNIERPALQRLLEDVQAGKVDIIVVYKIDRLTRSLSDFAKLVEMFDKHTVSFVSVTQSFNTTTSMGRLTLNVLLSFAQFEREVIGERIRDKVAASKKKGMWMGGGPVHGYDVKDRHLVINEEEAKVVKYIFNQYLELGSIFALRDHLKEKGIKSKAWISKTGRAHPGTTYSISGLGNFLKNPVYAGYIAHKEELYPGLHTAIIPREKWQKVQERLIKNAPFERGRKLARVTSLLKGKLFDENGVGFIPARGKKDGKQYRYYLNSRYIRKKDTPPGIIRRIPAPQIEDMVAAALKEEMQDIANLSNLLGISMRGARPMLERILKNADLLIDPEVAIKKVIINATLVSIVVDPDALVARAEDMLKAKIERQSSGDSYTFHFPFRTERIVKGAMVFRSQKQVQRLELSNRQKESLAKGILWRDQHFAGKSFLEIAKENKCSRSHVAKHINRIFDYSLYAG